MAGVGGIPLDGGQPAAAPVDVNRNKLVMIVQIDSIVQRVSLVVVVLRKGISVSRVCGSDIRTTQEFILMDNEGRRINAVISNMSVHRGRSLLRKEHTVVVRQAEVMPITAPLENSHPLYYLRLDRNSRVESALVQIHVDILPYQYVSLAAVTQAPRLFNLIDTYGRIAELSPDVNPLDYPVQTNHMSFVLETFDGSLVTINLEHDLASTEGGQIVVGQLVDRWISLSTIRVEFYNGTVSLRSTQATALMF